MTRRLQIGRVRSVSPARREVRVTPFPGCARCFDGLQWAYFVFPDAAEIRCRVEAAKAAAETCVLTLASGVTRDSVARLRGAVVAAEAVAPENTLPCVADLVGLEAVDASGSPIGRVTDGYTTGAHDVIEITKRDGRLLLLPVIAPAIADVDVERGVLTLGDIAPYGVESPKRRKTPRTGDED